MSSTDSTVYTPGIEILSYTVSSLGIIQHIIHGIKYNNSTANFEKSSGFTMDCMQWN